MLRLLSYLFLAILIFFSKSSFSVQSEWSNGAESQVRIISPFDFNNNQNEIFVGLEYKLQEDWKTYWKSPGEGGFPQNINWESSKNINNIEIFWPTPKYFEILGFTSIGYQNKVIFPLKIIIDDIKKETSIVLDIDYLTCKDICIPGKANLELIIPPGEAKLTEHYFTIQKALSSVPRVIYKDEESININSHAYENQDKISIVVTVKSLNLIQEPEFFIHSEFGLPVEKPKITLSPNSKKITAKFDYNKKIISKKNFTLNTIYKNNNNSIEYINDIKVEQFSNFSIFNNSLIYILIISLLGGMILNLMPCVLPVLSIKILSFLKSSKNKTSIGKSFLITSLGIISSFVFLAVILILLRILGVNIGWGMQFQQPIFLIIIATILFLFSLNTFGFYEFRTPYFLNSSGIKFLTSNSYFKDFFNGFFATILATPCSAPFVGTAITVAFTQSIYVMLGIFILMGTGMALPYLIFALFPNLIIFLPKPGSWMKYLRYFLGILIFGTFIWIISILLNHFSFINKNKNKFDSEWMDLTLIELDDLKLKNNIIFVDITADWCATCQYNKINVINSKKIIEEFKKNKIIKIQGDWTKPNEKIANFIQQYNRFGIPFNIFYSQTYPEGIILSEILTKKEILDTIEKIN